MPAKAAISGQVKPNFPKNPIVMGKLGSAYGLRGWLRVFSSTEKAAGIFDYQPWFIQRAAQWQHVALEEWKHHGQDLLIKVKAVDDREAASRLTSLEIFVDVTQLPPLETGDYYWKDLIGCQVTTTCGYQLGKVVAMMETGANDVMVVQANLNDAFGIRQRLLPFLDGQVIKKVSLVAQHIEAEWDPGF